MLDPDNDTGALISRNTEKNILCGGACAISVFVCVCVLFAKCEAMVLKTRELSRLKKKTLGVHIIYSSFTLFVCVAGI